MRKVGPLRNIKLCAYTLVGAESEDVLTPSVAGDVLNVAGGGDPEESVTCLVG